MKSEVCHVVGAGDFEKKYLKKMPGDLLIAADGGYEFLNEAGVKADWIMGDFDSSKKKPSGDNVLSFKSEKDDTDMAIAVEKGFRDGYRKFCIYGGTGGRLSHTLANIQLLANLCKKGAKGVIAGSDIMITAIKDGKIEFKQDFRGLISVFSHTEFSENVCINGLKYSLDGALLRNDTALGVSNEFTGDLGYVSVDKGILIIIIENHNIQTPTDLL